MDFKMLCHRNVRNYYGSVIKLITGTFTRRVTVTWHALGFLLLMKFNTISLDSCRVCQHSKRKSHCNPMLYTPWFVANLNLPMKLFPSAHAINQPRNNTSASGDRTEWTSLWTFCRFVVPWAICYLYGLARIWLSVLWAVGLTKVGHVLI